MNKSIYPILGFIIASAGVAGYWALSSVQPKEIPVRKEPKKISLLTFNFIPTTPARTVENIAFSEILQDTELYLSEKKLGDFKGKSVIVHFWATWCNPCVQELPMLDAFAGKYNQTEVLAIATDSKDISRIKTFYKTRNIQHLKIYVDDKGYLSRFFRPSALPATIFINSKGEEIGRISGIVEWNGLAGKLLNNYMSKN